MEQDHVHASSSAAEADESKRAEPVGNSKLVRVGLLLIMRIHVIVVRLPAAKVSVDTSSAIIMGVKISTQLLKLDLIDCCAMTVTFRPVPGKEWFVDTDPYFSTHLRLLVFAKACRDCEWKNVFDYGSSYWSPGPFDARRR